MIEPQSVPVIVFHAMYCDNTYLFEQLMELGMISEETFMLATDNKYWYRFNDENQQKKKTEMVAKYQAILDEHLNDNANTLT